MFKITWAQSTPLTLDEVKKRTFGHFVRVLLELDLASDLHERIVIERKNFDFYVDVEYEKLPLSCNSCQIFEHSIKNCRYQIPPKVQHSKPDSSNVEKVDVAIAPPVGTFPKMLLVVVKLRGDKTVLTHRAGPFGSLFLAG